ncbi:hypothetical protein DICSQDRAFT_134790 [Dichomitus squalens LYAD-421 SS1]|uniref:Uncharacterized protein n=1 Tax=Dichomitus squalens TaxID=114155 RepID=A0A4Q9PGM7_9APHY|nr:uncharacterized protein DICSQDRAFT_134790 [Dichomitus squalens LYAD-421 SS1]EJF63342.1 hypothetical protein DICSQDRAFT_134790 [Dichomitus squalens LYAD-421 SS1]TBU53645.1 hypothetical protein BD310DRAFT_937550 [Dichomitus squalens]
MSRGNREPAGIDNHTEHGVDEYYKRVGATYRNPHFPGVKSCLYSWLNRWWRMRQPHVEGKKFQVFDMACVSGEATLAVLEWWRDGRAAFNARQGSRKGESSDSEDEAAHTSPIVQARRIQPIGPDMPMPCILAADPYTEQAFHTRTSLYAHPLSFKDIAEGKLPEIASKPVGAPKPNNPPEISPESSLHGHSSLTLRSTTSSSSSGDLDIIEMVICSFALHLIEKPSELFALLWELSTKARWLVVLAPHNRPEIKDGWGWCKWDVETWSECRMSDSVGELLEDRVHCRVYRSLNV